MKEKIIVVVPHNKPFLGNQISQIPFYKKIKGNIRIVSLATKKSAFVLKEFEYVDEVIEYKNGSSSDFFNKILLIKKKYSVLEIYNFRRNSIDITFIILVLFRNTFGYISIRKNFFSIFYRNKFHYDLEDYIAKSYLKLCSGRLEDHYWKNQKLQKEILIIPGGSGEFKKYPLESYLDIAEYYSNRFKIGFVIGSDMEKEKEILKFYDQKYNIYIGLKLKKLEEIIKNSRLVIANDCGPSHFAHIYDIPRVSLFVCGKTPKHWFNSTENSILIQSIDKDIKNIPIKKVIESIDKLLES